MGASPPKPTPPREMAAAQTGANFSTSMMNNTMGMVNQRGPLGSLTYNQTGSQRITGPGGETYDVPRFTATTQLTGRGQGIMDLGSEAMRNAAYGLNKRADVVRQMPRKMDTSGMPGLVGGVDTGGDLARSFDPGGDIQTSYAGADDFSADRQRVEGALMDRMSRYIDNDREDLATRLANQGIGLGSEAFSDAQADFGRNVNDARLAAIINAGQEQARLVNMARDAAAFNNRAVGQQYNQNMGLAQFGNQAELQDFNRNLSAAQFQNAARTQDMQERMALRAQPVNEFLALQGGTQVQQPQFAQFQPQPVPAVNMAGIMAQNDQANMDRWQQRQAATGSFIGGLGGLASGIGGLMGFGR